MSGCRVLTLPQRRQRRPAVELSTTSVWLGNRRIGRIVERQDGTEALLDNGKSLGLFNGIESAVRALLFEAGVRLGGSAGS